VFYLWFREPLRIPVNNYGALTEVIVNSNQAESKARDGTALFLFLGAQKVKLFPLIE